MKKTKARTKNKPEGETSFADRATRVIRRIPRGRVLTYAKAAELAGNRRAARQIAWLLSAASEKRRLPWHRVINSQGRISLPRGGGFEEQRRRLLAEGVECCPEGAVSLARYLWSGAMAE